MHGVHIICLTKLLHIQSPTWPWPTYVPVRNTERKDLNSIYHGDYFTATEMLSCTVIRLGMVLQGKWNRWPWPSQKRSKRPGLLFGFPLPVCQWLELEYSYFAEWQMWGSHYSLFFGRPWPTFATVTHLNNGLWPPSTYSVVVCLQTTAAFLVHCLLSYHL